MIGLYESNIVSIKHYEGNRPYAFIAHKASWLGSFFPSEGCLYLHSSDNVSSPRQCLLHLNVSVNTLKTP